MLRRRNRQVMKDEQSFDPLRSIKDVMEVYTSFEVKSPNIFLKAGDCVMCEMDQFWKIEGLIVFTSQRRRYVVGQALIRPIMQNSMFTEDPKELISTDVIQKFNGSSIIKKIIAHEYFNEIDILSEDEYRINRFYSDHSMAVTEDQQIRNASFTFWKNEMNNALVLKPITSTIDFI